MLEDRPLVLPEAAYYFRAFEHLSTSRGRVDGYQPITIEAIFSYCDGMRVKETEEFMDMMKPLDRVFMDFYDEKRK